MKKNILKIVAGIAVLLVITLPLFFLINGSGNKKLKHPIEISTNGKFNKDGWANEDFVVKIQTKTEGFSYCLDKEECTPSIEVKGDTIELPIQEESDSIYVCAKLNNEEQSQEVECSKKYKLDKTNPEIGEITITGTMGSNDWYISDVTIQIKDGQDNLSGHQETTTNITEITKNTSGQTVVLTTKDKADNTVSKEYTIKIDKDSPNISFKTGNFQIYTEEEKEASSYFDYSFSISGGSVKCTPNNTQHLSAGSQKITCTAVGGNGKTKTEEKTLLVKPAFISKASESCFRKGRQCSLSQIKSGVHFHVAINDSETVKFYVLADDGEKVTAIASKNLGTDISASGTAITTEGPRVAVNTLKNRTTSWRNVTPRLPYIEELVKLTSYYQNTGDKTNWDVGFNQELINFLLSIDEDTDVETREEFIRLANQQGYGKLLLPKWTAEGLSITGADGLSQGYYTINSRNTNNNSMWVTSFSTLPLVTELTGSYGIRPVIELSKDKIG